MHTYDHHQNIISSPPEHDALGQLGCMSVDLLMRLRCCTPSCRAAAAAAVLQASLCEALRQLYVLDALDVDGAITGLGRTMAGLPLDPALARTLLEGAALG
jgi:hypothetical protein